MFFFILEKPYRELHFVGEFSLNIFPKSISEGNISDPTG